ncbi:DUF5916 domain-containing protein [Povalibacter sp.]|uniref:DUF5916 domain-containing protein n=1 Tax=Povalibacter sp. TaxID=1962978 RepID=UPI002F3F669B
MLPSLALGAIQADGQFDEVEWQQAVTCGQWRRTEPFARVEPRYPNDVRIVATPEGLAAAFTIDQPPGERRIKPRTPRDSEALAGDSVSLMIDFDATGQVGYEFSVGLGGGVRDGTITNQNEFNRDWDGTWQHAIRETGDQWFVEILVPWQAVNMRPTSKPMREIGVYATRYLFDRNERDACPGISVDSPAFLADFRRIEVAQYSAAAALDVVPYLTVVRDNRSDSVDTKAGVDVSWKPSPHFWLTATVNPDFGQVESDELVVDFSAVETVFTDKRPFFTENQNLFALATPANGQLIYTRRVGAAPDDGSAGSSDIDAALKISGSAGSLDYGTFAAQEHEYEDGSGRLFGAARARVTLPVGRVGYLGSWTDRPLLDREAAVNALDYDLTPNDWWRVAGQVIRSDINAGGVRSDGYQAWVQTDFNRSAPLSHTLTLLYIDDEFDLNDLGYMERNSLRQAEWVALRRLAPSNGRVNGETQELHLQYRENDAGERLQSRIQLIREVNFRSRWLAYEELRVIPRGIDDLISRGNGPVMLDTRYSAYADFTSPRLGAWQFVFGGYLFQQGIEDYSGWLQLTAAWYPIERLTLRLDLKPQYTDDWLLWLQDNDFGTYRAPRLDLDFRLDWIPALRHELRLRWQWIGIAADARQAWQTDADGVLQRTATVLEPFSVNSLGVQLRYRYSFAPQSDIYVVYARGGFDLLNDDDREVGQLFRDMDEVRSSDQFLIKFSYRL